MRSISFKQDLLWAALEDRSAALLPPSLWKRCFNWRNLDVWSLGLITETETCFHCFINRSAPTGCRSAAGSSACGSFEGGCAAVATSPGTDFVALAAAAWSWQYGPACCSTPTDAGQAPAGGAAGPPGPACPAAVCAPPLPSGIWTVEWHHRPARLMQTGPVEIGLDSASTQYSWGVLNSLKLKLK